MKEEKINDKKGVYADVIYTLGALYYYAATGSIVVPFELVDEYRKKVEENLIGVFINEKPNFTTEGYFETVDKSGNRYFFTNAYDDFSAFYNSYKEQVDPAILSASTEKNALKILGLTISNGKIIKNEDVDNVIQDYGHLFLR